MFLQVMIMNPTVKTLQRYQKHFTISLQKKIVIENLPIYVSLLQVELTSELWSIAVYNCESLKSVSIRSSMASFESLWEIEGLAVSHVQYYLSWKNGNRKLSKRGIHSRGWISDQPENTNN